MELAGGGGGGWQEMGLGVMASSSAAPSSPSSIPDMSDYYEFACQTKEAADGGGGGLPMGAALASNLSFRTCSSAPSSPRSVRSLSIDFSDFPPMSEWEEIPSRRWLPAFESLDATGDANLPPPATSARRVGEEGERKPSSRRWLLPPFLRPRSASKSDGDDGAWSKDRGDNLLWYRDQGRYAFGDFSVAVEQANNMLEDQCQIESGPFGVFVGVYDGHGGPEAARYVCDHLYRNFREISSGPLGVTSEAFKAAFLQTDKGFISMVAEMWGSKPQMAAIGTCCLVGVICHQTLYVANLGDSRVVLGTKAGNTGEIVPIQLSTEHNVNVGTVREKLKAQNPDDPDFVVLKHGIWRVKGIIQVSRSIGDAYLKHAEYNREPLYTKFRIPGLMNKPILSAKPSVISRPLHQNDSFLIFASDGLWEHLSNQDAVNIVHNHPHAGAARRLIKAALQVAARKREMKYSHLKQIDRRVRRHFFDDITVIVLFLNHDFISSDLAQAPSLSIRSELGLGSCDLIST